VAKAQKTGKQKKGAGTVRGDRGIGSGVVLSLVAISTMGCAGGGGDDAKFSVDGSASLQPLVTGLQLLNGNFELFGITTDDVVAVLDPVQGALAVPVSGDAVQRIDATSEQIAVAGPVIYSFHGVDPSRTFGDLTIWTSAHGLVSFATGATWPVGVSDDGAYLLATARTSSDGAQTNLVVGATDGTPPAVLFPIGLGEGCQPAIRFAAGRFVVAACAPGASEVFVRSIDPSDGTVIPLLAMAQSQITRIPGAATVALLDIAGIAYLADVASGHSTVIGQQVTAIVASPDGSAVLLQQEGTISVVPLTGQAGSVLPPTGVIGLLGASPDGQQLLFQTKQAVRPGFGGLWVTPTGPAGQVHRLSSEDDSTISDSPFTSDSQWALWFADHDVDGAGKLMAAPVSGGAASVLGTGAWNVSAAVGARIIYTDGYTVSPGQPGRAVLRASDLSARAAGKTLLATYVDPNFYLTHAHDQVVFSFADGTKQSGIYVAPVPR
jgi:hypothetical protein